MLPKEAYTNKILQGDCIEVMKSLPDKSVNLITYKFRINSTAPIKQKSEMYFKY